MKLHQEFIIVNHLLITGIYIGFTEMYLSTANKLRSVDRFEVSENDNLVNETI